MSNFIKVLKSLSEMSASELADLQQEISFVQAEKAKQGYVKMIEVVVEGFVYAVLKEDEISLALEIFENKVIEEFTPGVSFKSNINTINVLKSEVDNRRMIW